MIAIGILSISLMAIFSLQSTSLVGSARARHIAISTQLARQKMAAILIEIEQGIPKGDFPEDKEESGNFEEQKYPEYTWKLVIKKTTIPAPPVPEGGADIMATVFTMVSDELTKSTREVKLTVGWQEEEEDEQEGITLTTHVVKM